jgi:hypothetical protein
MSPLIFKIPVLGSLRPAFRALPENWLIFRANFRDPRFRKLGPNFPPQNYPENWLIFGIYFLEAETSAGLTAQEIWNSKS